MRTTTDSDGGMEQPEAIRRWARVRALSDPLGAAGQRGAEPRLRRARLARVQRALFAGTLALFAGLLGWVARDSSPPAEPAVPIAEDAIVVAEFPLATTGPNGETTWTVVRVIRPHSPSRPPVAARTRSS